MKQLVQSPVTAFRTPNATGRKKAAQSADHADQSANRSDVVRVVRCDVLEDGGFAEAHEEAEMRVAASRVCIHCSRMALAASAPDHSQKQAVPTSDDSVGRLVLGVPCRRYRFCQEQRSCHLNGTKNCIVYQLVRRISGFEVESRKVKELAACTKLGAKSCATPKWLLPGFTNEAE